MNIETMIVGIIGISAAVCLLRRAVKALGGETACSCSGGGCRVNRCSVKEK